MKNTIIKKKLKNSLNKIIIHLQIASRGKNLPSLFQFHLWISSTLQHKKKSGEITIRLVDKKESRKLNSKFRKKNYPTNILSFASYPHILTSLGDLVICAPQVKEEAKKQQKILLAHWAHLVIHGTLHLLGYNHEKKKEAAIMEALEILLLKKLGYPNPYEGN